MEGWNNGGEWDLGPGRGIEDFEWDLGPGRGIEGMELWG